LATIFELFNSKFIIFSPSGQQQIFFSLQEAHLPSNPTKPTRMRRIHTKRFPFKIVDFITRQFFLYFF